MTDKPIIFSAPMVRALLAGTKTQTRRVVRPGRGEQSKWLTNEMLHAPSCYLAAVDGQLGAQFQHPTAGQTMPSGLHIDRMSPLTWVPLPYATGDRLWVREGFALPWVRDGDAPRTCNPNTEVAYRAGHADATARGPRDDAVWRSPIHMPRWASRLTLIVTDVRVQRLAEISEEDARAEGCRASPWPGPWWQGYREIDGDLLHLQVISDSPPDWMIEPKRMRHLSHLDRTAIDDFRSLWDTIHGPGSWDANPWVAAITFDVRRCNIDDAEVEG